MTAHRTVVCSFLTTSLQHLASRIMYRNDCNKAVARRLLVEHTEPLAPSSLTTSLQVLTGDIKSAAKTLSNFYSLISHYGFSPELFSLLKGTVSRVYSSVPRLYPRLYPPLYPLCTPSVPPAYPLRTPCVPPLYPLCTPSVPPSVPPLYPFCTPPL